MRLGVRVALTPPYAQVVERQTRQTQTLVPVAGVRVQISPCAPRRKFPLPLRSRRFAARTTPDGELPPSSPATRSAGLVGEWTGDASLDLALDANLEMQHLYRVSLSNMRS